MKDKTGEKIIEQKNTKETFKHKILPSMQEKQLSHTWLQALGMLEK